MSDAASAPSSKSSVSSSSSFSWFDEWPQDFTGTGPGLLAKLQSGGLFRFAVQDVLQEVEKNLGHKVVEIPSVGNGSNYFGIHVHLDNGLEALVRVRRCDVNWPRYSGFPVDEQAVEVEFEAAMYRLLRGEPDILASHLLYHRKPVQRAERSSGEIPLDLLGRQIFVFEKAEGGKNVWPVEQNKRLAILSQCAAIRAALFRFLVPLDFVKLWMPQRPPSPKVLPNEIQATRSFAVDLLVSKVKEMIKEEGDMIGWESDHNVVGPVAARAKLSLLRLIPLILPFETDDDADFYRLVLEHGDFGIHNMTITESGDTPVVTSLYDFETGHIVPALLSDPQLATPVDFEVNGDGLPVLSRLPDGAAPEYVAEYEAYAAHYFKVLSVTTLDERAPSYLPAIKAGKDARHLWFALKAWRGDDPEEYFGELGSWADRRWQELR
ncbi:hypothetical protein C8R46DRAFT_59678 [Mycena filopes]|nr:hypothetical protein C8R46DRAFT_59678 [Mycena filopes]